MRKQVSFNDDWRFHKPGEQPVAVTLPHTWNAVDGQDGGNDYWRGTAAYEKDFAMPAHDKGERVILCFDGAAMTADVELNGTPCAHHEGGYATFRVDITDILQAENHLRVLVDNGANDRVYPQKADFTFYGGLYRSVSLLILPEKHFEVIRDGTPGIKVTPVLCGQDATVTVETWQDGAGSVTMTVAGQQQTVPSVDGHAEAVFHIAGAHLWDGTEDPYLYEAAAAYGEDGISARFGVRSIAFDPEQGFLLNGKPYPLHGVSRHQDRAGLGNALTEKEHREDMALIREIGANTIRLAHYQHDRFFYDLCDEYGMVVWAEIPYITKHMPSGRENTLTQMRELVTQCYNHPSIVCWGLSNEITANSPVDEDLVENHNLLNALCHRMDATRPTTMAHAFMLEKENPIVRLADICSYNLYYGWYLGELEENEQFFDAYHAQYPQSVIGFSEYGADANTAYQTAAPERSDYTEQYQCLYHEHLLGAIEARPYLWATHVWNMFDFAADGRDEGGAHGVNQKGLVTMDRRVKKDAFYLYKAHWSGEPFVHLCGSRFVDRTGDDTEVKAYTNLPAVTLTVDGRVLAVKQVENHMAVFTVPMTGEHTVVAEAGDCRDTIFIRKVAEENPAYSMQKKEDIVNWFDKDEIDETCYSIRDTMGEISRNPAGAAIIGRMMSVAKKSRGDVAEGAGDSPVIKKMLASMTVEKLIKMAGPAISPEMVRSLNTALQKIKKPV